MTRARPLAFSAERPLEPGRYRHQSFVPALSFEVGEGWFAFQDVPGFFDIERDPGTPDVMAVQFARPTGMASSEAMLASIRARGNLVIGPAASRLIDGERSVGVVVDAADPDITVGRFVPVLEVTAGPISIASGRRLEVILLDRPGELLAILVGGSIRGWETARALARPVLASIRFERA